MAFACALMLYLLNFNIITKCQVMEDMISCYSLADVGEVRHIVDETPLDNSIFFHETSCHNVSDYPAVLQPLQACAVESAARAHPNRSVYLLYSSPFKLPIQPISRFKSIGQRLVHTLYTEYDNIKIRRVILGEYVTNSILNRWVDERHLEEESMYPNIHASDVLRYLTLSKYGGIYLDLDVIILKNLDALGENYIGMALEGKPNSAVINFSKRNIGREMSRACLNYIVKDFQGYGRESLGPDLLNVVLKRHCNTSRLNETKNCRGFKILDSKIFYPIDWPEWRSLYAPDNSNQTVLTILKAYGIHIWKTLSHSQHIESTAKTVPLAVIARQHCPRVFKAAGKLFY